MLVLIKQLADASSYCFQKLTSLWKPSKAIRSRLISRVSPNVLRALVPGSRDSLEKAVLAL